MGATGARDAQRGFRETRPRRNIKFDRNEIQQLQRRKANFFFENQQSDGKGGRAVRLELYRGTRAAVFQGRGFARERDTGIAGGGGGIFEGMSVENIGISK